MTLAPVSCTATLAARRPVSRAPGRAGLAVDYGAEL